MADGRQTDPRIHRLQVKRAKIVTEPKMPVLADGFQIGEGSVDISIRPNALTFMAPHKK
jgi:diacylglycerol kinase family enzyme